jgi:hypothetical protein
MSFDSRWTGWRKALSGTLFPSWRNIVAKASNGDHAVAEHSVVLFRVNVVHMRSKSPIRKILAPFVMFAAVLYFLLDAIFLSFIRPISRALARLGLFDKLSRAIASLGPYTTLALFVVPVAVLEPAKPVGLYMIAEGHFVRGVIVIACAELLKIVIVERIYHIGQPKLMTIPLFARAHDFVTGWVGWFKAMPAWQAVTHQFHSIGRWTRSLVRSLRPARR